MSISKESLDEVALSEEEYELLIKRLGREPNIVELGMIGSLWSEHCGYKHSKPLLKFLPTKSERTLTEVGEENAGVVDIGDGFSVVMKMESHNHPSAIEPYQGAATGIGGIVRDIFTMGARPIALLNSLRFGPLTEPRNHYLFNGVVAGIAGYGNCLNGDERITVKNSGNIKDVRVGKYIEQLIPVNSPLTTTLIPNKKIEILSFSSHKNETCWQRVTKIFRRFSPEILEISAELGRKLKVTPDHPMLVFRGGRFATVNASLLEKGDELPLISSLPPEDFQRESEINKNIEKKLSQYNGTTFSFQRYSKHDDIATVKIKNIERKKEPQAVYDVEVENTHLFVTTGGIITHNCLGIPNVGGEIFFSDSYSANPLINVMCVGLGETKKMVKSKASGAGNLLILVGADTGRDGLHGASGLASRTFEEGDRSGSRTALTPAVQIGNPFLEKLLIEACLELAETDWIVGMQDLGAAGLTSAAVESADRGGSGIEIDVLKVPRREEGMTPYEVMISESQERMLVVVKKGCEDNVKALFDHWGLRSDIIGKVTDDGIARIKEGNEVVANVPIQLLMNPPLYQLEVKKPGWLDEVQSLDLNKIPDLKKEEVGDVFLELLSSPNIASKEWVYRQYDHQVLTNTVVPPGEDAAVLRIKGTKRGIALTTDGNGKYCYLDPFSGAAIAVAEAARNLVCSGAEPLAITDCLNFGNPEKLDVYYQLEQCIRGIAEACRVLEIPVISGNVSLYNETEGRDSSRTALTYPTPVIGMVGLLEDINKRCGIGFKDEGNLVLLLGKEISTLSGSEYLEIRHGIVAGKPEIDLDLEKRVQKCLFQTIKDGILKSAHDCSDGGLIVALAESCIVGNIGFKGEWKTDGRIDASLFGEAQSRVVISVEPTNLGKLEKIAEEHKVPLLKLGKVGSEDFVVGEIVNFPIRKLEEVWKMPCPNLV